MTVDRSKIGKKIHQLQKRIKRDQNNKGHNSKLKTRIRLKRLSELRKSLKND